MLHYADRVCTVHAYDENDKLQNDVPIVKVETGFISKDDRNYILVMNEALWMPNLNHTLISPNQLRAYSCVIIFLFQLKFKHIIPHEQTPANDAIRKVG